MAVRYNSTNPGNRLKQLKALEFGTRLTVEEVACYAKSSLLVLIIGMALWLGVKYRIVAFPFLGIN